MKSVYCAFALLIFNLNINGQTSDEQPADTNRLKNYSVSLAFQTHATSSLLAPNQHLGHREINQIFDAPKYYFTPQFDLGIHKRFNKNKIGIEASVIVYERILSLSFPISLKYSYDIFSDIKNTPYVFTNLGYSFFITEGSNVSFGLGYRYNRFDFFAGYTNQQKKYSALSANQFKGSRIASFSIGIAYSLLRF